MNQKNLNQKYKRKQELYQLQQEKEMELTQINKDYFQSFQTLSNNPNESEQIKKQLETIFNEKKYQQMSIHEKYNELKKRIDNEEIREYGIVLPNGFPSTYSFVIFTEERIL